MPRAVTPGPDQLLQMYAGMVRVRLLEERVRELFAAGRIPGFLHTSIGQEATAAGVAAALRPDDYVLSTHRGTSPTFPSATWAPTSSRRSDRS